MNVFLKLRFSGVSIEICKLQKIPKTKLTFDFVNVCLLLLHFSLYLPVKNIPSPLSSNQNAAFSLEVKCSHDPVRQWRINAEKSLSVILLWYTCILQYMDRYGSHLKDQLMGASTHFSLIWEVFQSLAGPITSVSCKSRRDGNAAAVTFTFPLQHESCHYMQIAPV